MCKIYLYVVGVCVGVKEVVVEYLFVEYLYVFYGECFVVDVGCVDCCYVVVVYVVYVFECEYVFGGVVLFYCGYVYVYVVGEVVLE